MTQEQLEQVILQNQESISRIESTVIKIKKKILWQEIASILKLILILGPLIIGIFYLSPYLKQYATMMNSVLSGFNLVENVDNQASVQGSFSSGEIQQLLCNPQSRENLVEQICN